MSRRLAGVRRGALGLRSGGMGTLDSFALIYGSNLGPLYQDTGFQEAAGDAAEDGDEVRIWTDDSGIGKNLEQAVSANRGICRATLGPNGGPCVEFKNRGGATPTWMDTVTAVMGTIAQPYGIVAVVKTDQGPANFALHDGNGGAARGLLYNTGGLTVYAGANGPAKACPVGWFLVESTFNGASSELRTNNGSAATGNPGAQGLGELVLGNSQFHASSTTWDGWVAFFMVIRAAQTASQRARMVTLLKQRYPALSI